MKPQPYFLFFYIFSSDSGSYTQLPHRSADKVSDQAAALVRWTVSAH